MTQKTLMLARTEFLVNTLIEEVLSSLKIRINLKSTGHAVIFLTVHLLKHFKID
jgi:hypothetical protein